MNTRKPADRLMEIYGRWSITIDEEQAFEEFRNRACLDLKLVTDFDMSQELAILNEIALVRGDRVRPKTIESVLSQTHSLGSFLATAQLLFDAIERSGTGNPDEFAKALSRARDHSPMIDFIIAEHAAGIFVRAYTILPAGVPELDGPLVVETLQWLDPHKEVAARFENALRTVLKKDSANYRGALDDLRWSLEQLLRAVLGNEQPLEGQKPHIARWLKDHGVHQSVVQLYVDLQTHFKDYQNDAVKHGEKWSEDEIEFMVYLTGSFMRLVLRLSAKG